MFNVAYPNNWQVLGDPNASDITIAPQDGVVTHNGNTEIGYGAILSYFVPDNNSSDLRSATDDLIHHLHVDNPRLAATSKGRATRVGGTPGLLTTLSSSSPLGGDETDLLLTAVRPPRPVLSHPDRASEQRKPVGEHTTENSGFRPVQPVGRTPG